ncbi:hypothetical protein VTO42DRAFT_4210 [Malbranchea cinnamomea]
MDYLIRFAQVHESFRKPEIQALATLANIHVEFLVYSDDSPFCIVRLQDETEARKLIARSILAKGIYELWGQGKTYRELHDDVRRRTADKWGDYLTMSFKFSFDSYRGKRSPKERNSLIQSFAFLGFQGPIIMVNPDEEFCIFEEYSRAAWEEQDKATAKGYRESPPKLEPRQLYFGRWLSKGSREAMDYYDLKKRRYISTTSMDAELALITANMALADEDKVFFDPFVGTGSFCVAAAHFGAHVFGADIDGRSFRGKDRPKEKPIGLVDNMEQYGLERAFLDVFTSDLTNTPFRNVPLFDGIICDPPYGVREGLKVLGSRSGEKTEVIYKDGIPTYYLDGYIPPKRQYSFEALLDDILNFGAATLVPNGRISLWMPTANEDDVELEIPTHPYFQLVSVCVQPFSKWSRRLLTYRKLPDNEVSEQNITRQKRSVPLGKSADEVNAFRRKYFTKTEKPQSARTKPSSFQGPT